MTELKKVKDLIFSFFCESHDFNGIPLRDISNRLGLKYEPSIDLVKQLVEQGSASIQSSTNPHIIGFKHHDIRSQLEVLDHAKNVTSTKKQFGNLSFVVEETDYPICVYPSKEYLKKIELYMSLDTQSTKWLWR